MSSASVCESARGCGGGENSEVKLPTHRGSIFQGLGFSVTLNVLCFCKKDKKGWRKEFFSF
jgi:hypothetical protein